MKNLLSLALVISFSAGVQAQQLKANEIPDAVKASFESRHPHIAQVKWSKENADEFEAEFKVNGVEISSNFNTGGTWLVTETEIQKTALPAAVQATLTKSFAGYKVKELEKVETPDGMIAYEAEVVKGKETLEVQISPSGEVLKKEVEKSEKGDQKD